MEAVASCGIAIFPPQAKTAASQIYFGGITDSARSYKQAGPKNTQNPIKSCFSMLPLILRSRNS